MKNIYDYSLEQLTEYFALIKQKPFRAKQVFSWLYQKDAYQLMKCQIYQKNLEII